MNDPDPYKTYLYESNKECHEHNHNILDKNPNKLITILSKDSINNKIEDLEDTFYTETRLKNELELKIGCQVSLT